jgi:hypothetical protein
MEEISALSSRVHVSRNSASFTYHYGDFPADPIKVLMRHFDALFYMAVGALPFQAAYAAIVALTCVYAGYGLGERYSRRWLSPPIEFNST